MGAKKGINTLALTALQNSLHERLPRRQSSAIYSDLKFSPLGFL